VAGQLLGWLGDEPLGKAELAHTMGKSGPTRYLHDLMRRLRQEGLVDYTIPDKPNSRLQKYRLTPAGRAAAARQHTPGETDPTA
jgi:ATP-dependent DNA helicase RecG